MRMNTSPMAVVEDVTGPQPSAAALRDLGALRQAVGRALDRKRRLGQYAVVWQDGALATLAPEALPALGPELTRGASWQAASTLSQSLSAREPMPRSWEEPADPPPQG